MIVKKLEKKELEEVKVLYSESFELSKEDIKYEKDNIYVVCDEERVLGMCMVDYIEDIFKKEKGAYINLVCVKKYYRNKGIATFMLKEIEKICKEEGASKIMLTSSSKRKEANHVYKKLDYIVHETNVFIKKI